MTMPEPGADLEYYAGIVLFVGVAAWRSGPYRVRVAVFIAPLFALQAVTTIDVGYTLSAVMLALMGVVAGGLLLGVRWAIAGWLLSAVVFLTVGILTSSGTVASTFNPGSIDPRDIDACYAAGANSYVQKPVGLDGYKKVMQRIRDFWFELAIVPPSSS